MYSASLSGMDHCGAGRRDTRRCCHWQRSTRMIDRLTARRRHRVARYHAAAVHPALTTAELLVTVC
jgi:hypothetical protein